MKHIAVFCSAQNISEAYTKPAEEFGRLMVAHGYDLVWGGSDKGLMSILATAVQQNGGKLVGVSIPYFEDVARKNADEMILAKDLSERKTTMLARSDAIVMLVGGVGTLDELMEIVERKKQKEHNKPIVILNTNNFYEGLRMLLDRMLDEGFIPKDVGELAHVVNTPQEAIEYIDAALARTG